MAVNIRDVAERAGVSVGTVSNVLNRSEKVAPAVAERVRAAIAALGYVRNDAARQLRAGRSRSIGLVVLDLGNPFFAAVARGAQRRADRAGMSVLVGSSDGDPTREAAYLDLFREQRVNGVLLSPTTSDVAPLEQVAAAGVPIVLVDSAAPDDRFSAVSVDDEQGGYLAASHLLSLGRRRLAVVAGPRGIRQVAERLSGAERAVGEVTGATLEVIERSALDVLQGRAAGEEIAARDAVDRPDAVFALNDLLAMGVIQAVTMNADLAIPGDIALVGYDDIDFASATVVPLSSVRQPAEMLGETAVDILLDHLDGGTAERTRTFRPTLVVRASTG